MKKLTQYFINSTLRITTTILLMAAPVAVVAYASEPVTVTYSYTASSSMGSQQNLLAAQFDIVGDRIDSMKPRILDETIASALKAIK